MPKPTSKEIAENFEIIEKAIRNGEAQEDIIPKIATIDNAIVFPWIGLVLEKNKSIVEFQKSLELFNKIKNMNVVQQFFLFNREIKNLQTLIQQVPIHSTTRYPIHILFLIFEGLHQRNQILDKTKPLKIPMIGQILRVNKTQSLVNTVRNLEQKAKKTTLIPLSNHTEKESKNEKQSTSSTQDILKTYLQEQGITPQTLEEKRLLRESEDLLRVGYPSVRLGHFLHLRIQQMQGQIGQGLVDQALTDKLPEEVLLKHQIKGLRP